MKDFAKKDFYCNPYDNSKAGFYFNDAEELEEGLLTADFEEYEIVCINYPLEYQFKKLYDGTNFSEVTEFLDNLDGGDEETTVEYLCDRGYSLDEVIAKFGDVYTFEGTPEDYAIEIVEQGCFGEIPESIRNYIDYDAIARDLICGGDIVDMGNGYLVINNNDF